MSMDKTIADDADLCGQPQFKFVCVECGSLSIKITDPAKTPANTLVHCGRCAAVRGTLRDLHDLARRGKDLFEFYSLERGPHPARSTARAGALGTTENMR